MSMIAMRTMPTMTRLREIVVALLFMKEADMVSLPPMPASLAELSVHQAGAVAVQKICVVEFLDFRCKVVVYRVGCTCHTGNGVYVIAACKSAVHDVDHVRCSEELQVKLFLII